MANLQGMPGRSLQGLYNNLQGYGFAGEIFFTRITNSTFDYDVYKGPINSNSSSDFSSSLNGNLSANFGRGMKVYKNRLYFCDGIPATVSVYDRYFNFQLQFGSTGTGDGEFFYEIRGIHVYNDEIYVGDFNAGRIQVFDLFGNYVRKFTVTTDPDITVRDIFVKNNKVYVGIMNSNISNLFTGVIVYDTNGVYISEFGGYGTGDGELTAIQPNTISSIGDNLYIANLGLPSTSECFVQIFDLDGNFVDKFETNGTGDGEIETLTSLSTYGSNVYLMDKDNERIAVFDANMSFIRNIDIDIIITSIHSPHNLIVG